jgi:Flp pilus assembly protein protease CpaA
MDLSTLFRRGRGSHASTTGARFGKLRHNERVIYAERVIINDAFDGQPGDWEDVYWLAAILHSNPSHFAEAFALIAPPSTAEWIWVYGPLLGVLLLAMVLEIQANRIPNWFTFETFAYFLAVRIAFGPEPLSKYVTSIFIVCFVAIGIGYLCGFIGGGVAKLAIAISPSLEPTLISIACLFAVALYVVLMAGAKICGRRNFPGSLVITIVVVGAIALAATRRPPPELRRVLAPSNAAQTAGVGQEKSPESSELSLLNSGLC